VPYIAGFKAGFKIVEPTFSQKEDRLRTSVNAPQPELSSVGLGNRRSRLRANRIEVD
jgi:hypothetical protein